VSSFDSALGVGLGFGQHTLDFDGRVFTKAYQQRLTLRHQVHKDLERALREHGVEITLPQLDLRVREQTRDRTGGIVREVPPEAEAPPGPSKPRAAPD